MEVIRSFGSRPGTVSLLAGPEKQPARARITVTRSVSFFPNFGRPRRAPLIVTTATACPTGLYPFRCRLSRLSTTLVTSSACSKNRRPSQTTEGSCSVGLLLEVPPRLGGHRRPVLPLRLRTVGREIVLSHGTRQALVVERLEVARCRQVQEAAVASRESAVRHLHD